MTSVRDAVFGMLADRGLTTIFGNPGSTELPMLAEFPADFRYVLGLHEAVAVGMADGYAQATGKPAHGVEVATATGREELRERLSAALGSSRPSLVEVPVEPGMTAS